MYLGRDPYGALLMFQNWVAALDWFSEISQARYVRSDFVDVRIEHNEYAKYYEHNQLIFKFERWE